MLDLEMREQLQQVFSKLDGEIVLKLASSAHEDQPQLVEMLESVSSTSPKIRIEKSSEQSQVPAFEIWTKARANGIRFRGIPGGHEFTSLIVAILNSDNKGKLPDAGIIRRIQALKGPIRLSTYVSLTCENCPDVVQALNLMASLHADFQHEMVDGGYVQNEVERLGIQGVPSVIHNEKLLHSGKTNLLELLEKLEKQFGSVTVANENQDLGLFDVVVIGGGPAGASAAIYSVRKGLKTALVAERFGGQVQDTKGIENLVSVPYIEGPQLAAHLNSHIQSYPVTVLEHRRVKTIKNEKSTAAENPHIGSENFVTEKPTTAVPLRTIQFESGESMQARAIIVATGAKWRELGVPGEKEYLGRGVAFCPHCDGPYYKGKKVAVIGGGNSGVEAAIDLSGIVREVVLLEFQDQLKADQVLVNKLKSLPNISVLTGVKTEEVLGDGQKVHALKYQERATGETKNLPLDGVFVQIGLLPNSQFIKDKVETTKFGEIIVDQKGRTSSPGIYAAGDVTTTPYKQIIIAMGEGAKAALAAFEDRMLAPNL